MLILGQVQLLSFMQSWNALGTRQGVVCKTQDLPSSGLCLSVQDVARGNQFHIYVRSRNEGFSFNVIFKHLSFLGHL